MLYGGAWIRKLDQLHEDHFIEAYARIPDFGRWGVWYGTCVPKFLKLTFVNGLDAVPVLERD